MGDVVTNPCPNLSLTVLVKALINWSPTLCEEADFPTLGLSTVIGKRDFMGVSSWTCSPLQWRHNGRDSVSNHQPNDCLLNRLFRRRSKKTAKLHVTGLCARNSPATGEFPAQMASNAENVSLWWRHHETISMPYQRFLIAIIFCPHIWI